MAQRPATVQVQPGDDVLAIVRRYDVSMPSLIALNGLQPPYALQPGQTLRLPGAPGSAPGPAPTITLPGAVATAPGATAPMGGTPLNTVPSTGGGLSVQRLPPPGGAAGPVAPGTVPPAVPGAVPPAGAATGQTPVAPTTGAPTSIVPKPPPATVPPVASATVPPPAATQAPRASSRFAWPVTGSVIAGFNAPLGGKPNQGINISAPAGTPIKAAGPGTVAYAGNELRGYGNLVLIQHGDGLVTAYAHAASLSVKKGDQVTAGQSIGTVGQTGAVDAPQLHFEVRKNSAPVDPKQYLP
ncbi:M23 family metallopeptidase [Inquilinus sp. Marseille-Q2685]|uniref:M23 family metallopeptidase n=1 Tax=Inquilinus sp. Marseille-Q2685 TaxID=2866581 RepID=UPI001CE49D22|nr:M23 family metallopeptidase [Inquilinus sp. Marseille-Q2685]